MQKRSSKVARFLALTAATVVLGACGSSSSDTPVDTGQTGQDVVSDGGSVFPDVVRPRPDEVTGDKDTGSVDTGLDIPRDTGIDPPEDVGPIGPNCPGDPLCECSDNNQCRSGWCVEGPDGRYCSKYCIDECWDGWTCVLVDAGAGPDRQSICVHKFPRLCQACESNNDCSAGVTGGSTALCMSYGDEGNFCGGFCQVDTDCPEGYACEEGETIVGVPARQCVPADGAVCGCNDKLVAGGYTTSCGTSNDFGTCTGQRYCTDEGLTDCSAGAPMQEVCDGVDNDCSGIIDDNIDQSACNETNAFGTCYGVEICAGGQRYCDAATPQPEACDTIDNDCDGLTDEDFSEDIDGNGVIDCLDEDMDGDGISNLLDNCPRDFNPMQENNDRDLEGDACDIDDDNDYVPDTEDCKPFDNTIYPGAAEVCDGDDENCDNQVDEGFADTDEDGEADCVDVDDDDDDVTDPNDNCPLVYNPRNDQGIQLDTDHDGDGDACDRDDDNDGIWDDGDNSGDITDNVCPDGIIQGCDDNCQKDRNPNQEDADEDGMGDACDPDDDNDEVPDAEDNCPFVPNYQQLDYDGDDIGDACDPDMDNDGTGNGQDCDPLNEAVYPLAPEICDGVDNDCDGDADEEGARGCTDYGKDLDGDGHGTADIRCLCAPTEPYTAIQEAEDCDDTNPNINPGMQEICNNGIDDDCNGSQNDENAVSCIVFFTDQDGDGYGVAPFQCLCGQVGAFRATSGGDCDDLERLINPGQPETCSTPYDDNCNNDANDEDAYGCTTYYWDHDNDGYGVEGDGKCLCQQMGSYGAVETGDCNDEKRAVNPGELEVCGNADDDNCDGYLDEEGASGCTDYYLDQDEDGYGLSDERRCLCNATNQHTAIYGGDCNDLVPELNPGALEICNNYDDNCDLLVDAEEVQHSVLCEQTGGAFQCIEGECQLASCPFGDNPMSDINGISADGCECEVEDSEHGDTASTAYDVGSIPDTGSQPVVLTGKVAGWPNGEAIDTDWFRFNAVDTPDSSCDHFKVVVKFVSNPDDQFQFAVYRGGAAGANEVCTEIASEFSWYTNFFVEAPYTSSEQPVDTSHVGGECGCRAPTGTQYSNTDSTHHICADNTAVFYVAVTRRAGVAATCDSYSIEFSNGFYP